MLDQIDDGLGHGSLEQEIIRRFEEDYRAQLTHLNENYRSTANIIRAAKKVILPSAEPESARPTDVRARDRHG